MTLGRALQVQNYSRSEMVADAVMHGLGLAATLAAILLFAIRLAPGFDFQHAISIVLYLVGAVAMFGCSALYNFTSRPRAKQIFQRFDHAAIYLMIAGSYTPFALIGIGGPVGFGLFAFVWAISIAGMTMKLLNARLIERLSFVPYIALGWAGMAVLPSLLARLSTGDLVLLLIGGLCYTGGVAFLFWRSLRFHNAIWHAFVLAGTFVQFSAILHIAGS